MKKSDSRARLALVREGNALAAALKAKDRQHLAENELIEVMMKNWNKIQDGKELVKEIKAQLEDEKSKSADSLKCAVA